MKQILISILVFTSIQSLSAQLPQVYAIVVSCGKFTDARIPTLQYAENDALAFASFLKKPIGGGIPAENIAVLTNEQATRPNILRDILKIIKRVRSEDLFIFYFSGHGQEGDLGQSGYFFTYDTDFSNAIGTSLHMSDVNSMLAGCKAKMTLSYIDCCHAGLFSTQPGKKGPKDNSEIIRSYLQAVADADEGFAYVMSSTAREQSIEDVSLGHGVFTHFLLKALEGSADSAQAGAPGFNDGMVTLGEVKTYLTAAISKATNFEQTPTFGGNYSNQWPLSVVKPGASLGVALSNYNKTLKSQPPVQEVKNDAPGLDISSAQARIDRAVQVKDGSSQGQSEALGVLVENGHQFENSDFNGINFSKAIISKGIFTNATFRAGDLNEMVAFGSNLSNCTFTFTKFNQAKLNGAKLNKSGGSFMECRGTDFRGADLTSCQFFCGDFRGANFTGANLKGAKLLYADLRGAIFDSADLSQAFLTGSVLDSVSFTNTIINQTDFFGAVSKQWTLSKTQLAGACRQYSAYLGEYLTYEVSLTEQRESDRFSSGYEYDKILDRYYNTAVLSSFGDRSLPVCTNKVLDEDGKPWEVTWSAHRDLTLDRSYFSKGNRKQLFKDKTIAYREFLSSRLKVQYALKGGNEDKKKWQATLAANIKNVRPRSLPYLNTDLMVVLMAKNGLLRDDVSWKDLSAQYSNMERGIREKEKGNFSQFSMWEQLYPAEVLQYWNELNADTLAQAYKQWVIGRAPYAPDKIVVKFPVALKGVGNPVESGYDIIRSLTGFNYPEGIYPIDTYNMSSLAGDENFRKRVFPMPVYRNLFAYYIFPKEMAAYNFEWPKDKEKDEMYLQTEISITKIEKVSNNYNTGVLVYVVPKKIALLSGGKQIWEKKFE